jgi:hydrogenase expression/formation protein HypC
MCLAIPGKLIQINSAIDPAFRTGIVSFNGVNREVNLSMLPEAVENDYVLVHVGLALSIIDEAEADKIKETLDQAELEDWGEGKRD